MEEKILTKSQKYNVKKLFIIFVIIGLGLSLIMILCSMLSALPDDITDYNEHNHGSDCPTIYGNDALDELYSQLYQKYYKYYSDWAESDIFISKEAYAKELIEKGSLHCSYNDYSNAFSYALSEWWHSYSGFLWSLISLITVGALSLIGFVIFLWLNCYSLTVSDKKVSGEVLFGKKVDLPIDSVSAISLISAFKGIGISTSSGRISFLAIKNSDEIYKIMNELIINRQKEKEQPPAGTNSSDETEQLKKYKELLDSGIITEEEFNAKKKQLLGL